MKKPDVSCHVTFTVHMTMNKEKKSEYTRFMNEETKQTVPTMYIRLYSQGPKRGVKESI